MDRAGDFFGLKKTFSKNNQEQKKILADIPKEKCGQS